MGTMHMANIDNVGTKPHKVVCTLFEHGADLRSGFTNDFYKGKLKMPMQGVCLGRFMNSITGLDLSKKVGSTCIATEISAARKQLEEKYGVTITCKPGCKNGKKVYYYKLEKL